MHAVLFIIRFILAHDNTENAAFQFLLGFLKVLEYIITNSAVSLKGKLTIKAQQTNPN